jgi:hypothetical protein
MKVVVLISLSIAVLAPLAKLYGDLLENLPGFVLLESIKVRQQSSFANSIIYRNNGHVAYQWKPI